MSSTATSIRHATPEDLASIERLLTDADLPTAGVAEILNERPAAFFVAEPIGAPGQLVAVAGLEMCCDDALLRSVAITRSGAATDSEEI